MSKNNRYKNYVFLMLINSIFYLCAMEQMEIDTKQQEFAQKLERLKSDEFKDLRNQITFCLDELVEPTILKHLVDNEPQNQELKKEFSREMQRRPYKTSSSHDGTFLSAYPTDLYLYQNPIWFWKNIKLATVRSAKGITAYKWHPHKNLVALANDASLFLFNAQTEKTLWQVPLSSLYQGKKECFLTCTRCISRIEWSPDARLLLIFYSESQNNSFKIGLVQGDNGSHINSMHVSGRCNTVHWLPDNQTFILADDLFCDKYDILNNKTENMLTMPSNDIPKDKVLLWGKIKTVSNDARIVQINSEEELYLLDLVTRQLTEVDEDTLPDITYCHIYMVDPQNYFLKTFDEELILYNTRYGILKTWPKVCFQTTEIVYSAHDQNLMIYDKTRYAKTYIPSPVAALSHASDFINMKSYIAALDYFKQKRLHPLCADCINQSLQESMLIAVLLEAKAKKTKVPLYNEHDNISHLFNRLPKPIRDIFSDTIVIKEASQKAEKSNCLIM